ncbi:Hypothetical protein FKW44_020253 [Caligus rogercresseyi]|uniref:Uncharacterized protein n=1 Tax=Caligus rogercresseyi TaxID=217165 RepID=A0A7T8GXA2_CALRO|nr:Hypothetical protein FKW44_020253 [Caligus rogercresseyi]
MEEYGNVCVLPDTTTDHRPVLAEVNIKGRSPSRPVTIRRRNFKAIKRHALENALEQWKLDDIYDIKEVDSVLDFIVAGITMSLDKVAPVRAITVQTCI